MNDTFGLDNLVDLGSLLQSGNATSETSGIPMQLDINLIKEDPNQPRKHFDEEKLSELSASIAERGVKTPISVRVDDVEAGTYIINHGARRFRASVMAGKKVIPAYIDDDYSLVDQTVENIQRDNLSPREIADVIGRLMAEGMKKGEIAAQMGKSPAFITQHANLLDLPDPLAVAFNNGRISDITVLNDLSTLYMKHPEKVDEFLMSEEEVTRGSVRNLRGFISSDTPMDNNSSTTSSKLNPSSKEDQETEIKQKTEKVEKKLRQVVQVTYQNRLARLILNKHGNSSEEVWIRFDEDEPGEEKLVLCKDVSGIVSILFE